MVIQMPVFIALYQGLMRSLELRNAKFLWIKDLSMPEQIPLPFALPMIGDKINLLPLMMMQLLTSPFWRSTVKSLNSLTLNRSAKAILRNCHIMLSLREKKPIKS